MRGANSLAFASANEAPLAPTVSWGDDSLPAPTAVGKILPVSPWASAPGKGFPERSRGRRDMPTQVGKSLVGRPAREAKLAVLQGIFKKSRVAAKRQSSFSTCLPGQAMWPRYVSTCFAIHRNKPSFMEKRMTKISKMEIGRGYRKNTLALLARLGYATTRQVAVGVLGGCNLIDRKHVSRILRRLLSMGLIVERRENGNASGERLVALTRAGVAALAEEMPLPGGRNHGRDWLRHMHKHRTACNGVWVALYRGLVAPGWSEIEIRNGEAPAHLSLFRYRSDGEIHQKIPDLLVEYDQDTRLPRPIWVEVENGWRGAKDFLKLVGFVRSIFNTKTPLIHEIWFVITAPGAHTIGKRLRAALSHDVTSGYAYQAKALDARILAHCIKIFRLDAQTLELSPILL
jgi:DNA-binding MarR family transcriptional regulator